jgi:hypothetical protein
MVGFDENYIEASDKVRNLFASWQTCLSVPDNLH